MEGEAEEDTRGLSNEPKSEFVPIFLGSGSDCDDGPAGALGIDAVVSMLFMPWFEAAPYRAKTGTTNYQKLAHSPTVATDSTANFHLACLKEYGWNAKQRC